jgi:NADH:ubiquinone reductase (H+-translocating)
VLLAEVVGVDLGSQSVDADCPGIGIKKVGFDYLVIAAGMQSSYFGHDEFAKYASCLKTITDAEAIRSKVLSAYELAESTDDEDERRQQMTFVLVGAGPTGVELAASLAQMATTTLRKNFRRIDPATTTIVLLDGVKRILPSFAESLSKKAAKRLAKLGVQVIADTMVEVIDDRGVTVGGKLIPCGAVLWTAGVSPSPVVKMLRVATDRAGRASVGPSLSVPDTPGIFVVGDTATLMQNGKPLPGVAQVAIQQGRYVGRLISRELGGRKPPRPFRYFDKGNMAVVGKNFAIMESGRIRLAGLTAWFVWAFIHLLFLPQLQNRLRVERQSLWSYFTAQRGSRLVAEPPRIGK